MDLREDEVLVMEELMEKYTEIEEMLDMSDVLDSIDSETSVDAPVREGILGGQATQAGIQTQDLQSVISGWTEALNNSAIAKSTGLPVRTPVVQYKGFAAEEFFKQTMKINALAKGVPNYKIGVYTNGELPDGTTLSGIDMHSDIVVFSRKWPWQNASKIADAQSKMHKGPNAAKAYAKDMAKEQYAQQEFVGGANQGVNDKVHAQIGKIEVTSDSITPEAAEQLAADMKKQAVPEYEHATEKQQQLNRINIRNAVATGAITGAALTAIGEICYVIRNKDSLSKEQFIKSVQHILCGAVDGGVRGGAIMGSVQSIGKALGREIPANSLGAVPIMAAANVSVDFAKDLYRCFVAQTIDPDDLLCNSINNSFSSLAGFGGAWAGGQIAGQVIAQSTGTAVSAKIAAATGASIGSAVGPLGTIVGAAVGGLLIGLGANAVIKVGNADAEMAFNNTIKEIDSHIEFEGCEKLYYFAEVMSELSEFRLSFKDLLPCYNLISDLKEYNLHKKAIKHIHEQLDSGFEGLDKAKVKALKQLEAEHQHRLLELQRWLRKQREIMYGEYREAVKTYVLNSYIQYAELYDVLAKDVSSLLGTLQYNVVLHNSILSYCRNRNAVNSEINDILDELMKNPDDQELVRPFIEEMIRFIQQDEFLVDKQYISFKEALFLVCGEGVYEQV